MVGSSKGGLQAYGVPETSEVRTKAPAIRESALRARIMTPSVRLLTHAGRLVGDDGTVDPIPPEALLAGYPPPMRAIAQRLRAIVRRAVPDAVERVRSGWRLIGYDVPAGPRRLSYFCYVAPEVEHVHLGFEYGVFMSDPERALIGAGVTRKVRWLTFRHGDPLPEPQLIELVQEGSRMALASPAERLAVALDRDERPAAVR